MNITIPHMMDITAFSEYELIGCFLTCLIAVLTAIVLGYYCAIEFKGNKSKVVFVIVGITFVLSLLLISFFGFAATTLRGIIISLALLFCSYSDIKTRSCPDAPFLIIAVAAFIGCPLSFLPNMFFALTVALVLLLGSSMATRTVVNGADLKCTMACCFVLGLTRGLIGLFIGQLIAIIVNLIITKDKKAGFPLLPYLAIGFMIAYFL